MRKYTQEQTKIEVMSHAEVRRSVRIKTDIVTKQLPHISYRNTLKDLSDAKPPKAKEELEPKQSHSLAELPAMTQLGDR
eukprot:CAMPEP_0173444138 /NCGR_PEP_ID=MMETSP1357-20121228/31601_1 /TAXON_ID=77926 /ORGANISM="Hemiselmis rufescens, Strain PCC563" /LENGTH=78 /DNA_ID=CAMNT_0014410149 /DNA_START=36 /DNA_END=269 /DNA_ORIENTATION=+